MEDLGFSDRGAAVHDVISGNFDLDGRLSVDPDGGLKSFGHPIGASGLRMLFECWLQLRNGRRPSGSYRPSRKAGSSGYAQPRRSAGACVSFVSIVGSERTL